MQRLLAAALLLLAFLPLANGCAASGVAAGRAKTPAPLRILFVGNSLTYYNDLPAKVAALRNVSGPHGAIHAEMLAEGGASLRDRLRDGSLAQVLSTHTFDVVVLQDFGTWPLCSTQIAACETGSHSLREAVALVRRHGARPVWFATWMPPALQPALSEASARTADDVGVDWVDVGGALRNGASTTPTLLHADGHPAPLGSWLAAMALLQQIQPDLHWPEHGEISACGRIWQGQALASTQAQPATHCDVLPASTLRRLRKAVEHLPSRHRGSAGAPGRGP